MRSQLNVSSIVQSVNDGIEAVQYPTVVTFVASKCFRKKCWQITRVFVVQINSSLWPNKCVSWTLWWHQKWTDTLLQYVWMTGKPPQKDQKSKTRVGFGSNFAWMHVYEIISGLLLKKDLWWTFELVIGKDSITIILQYVAAPSTVDRLLFINKLD